MIEMDLVRLQRHLNKFLMVYVAVSMIAGFYAGININVKPHESLFKTLNLIVVITMIYPMMINLRFGEMKHSMKLWKQLTIGLAIGLIVAPLLMYGLVELISLFTPVNSKLALGLILAVVVPCSSMSIAYTGFTKGNIELSTIVVAISFTLAIATVPVWLRIFASAYNLDVSSWLLIKTIIIVVVVPMILGVLTRMGLLKKAGTEGFLRIKPLFPSISLLGMYAIVFLIFMEKAKLVESKVTVVGIALIPLVLYYIVLLIFLTYFDKWLRVPYKDHMAITFTSVGKNEGTAMAIAMAAGMGVMAIPAAVTPILQIPMLVGYVKVADKVRNYFGENEPDEPEEEPSPLTPSEEKKDAEKRKGAA